MSIVGSIYRSWWVVLFALFCYVCYERGVKIRNNDFSKLSQQYEKLVIAKNEATKKQVRLIGEIKSQNDPEWIELTLMKSLGLVPEGYTKVLFTNDSEILKTYSQHEP